MNTLHTMKQMLVTSVALAATLLPASAQSLETLGVMNMVGRMTGDANRALSPNIRLTNRPA